jgi:hypothetical protein
LCLDTVWKTSLNITSLRSKFASTTKVWSKKTDMK